MASDAFFPFDDVVKLCARRNISAIIQPGGSIRDAGAYPSACGKTSTAMVPGEQVVGDDIAYFRKINGEFHAVNVEQGTP